MTLLNDGELNALGVDRTSLGEAVKLGRPDDAIAYGARPRAAIMGLAAIIASHYAGLHFAQARVPLVEELSSRLEVLDEDPRIVKFVGPADAILDVRVLDPATDAYRLDPDDPATVLLDLGVGRAARITLPQEDGCLLVLRSDGLEVVRVYRDTLAIEPLAAIESPVGTWCRDAGDSWLRSEVESRLATRDAWQHAVAIGLFARLGGFAGSRSVPLAPQALAYEAMARPRRWARDLGAKEIATLDVLATAEVMKIEAALGALWDDMACDDAGWREDLLAACRARDDLEGVRLLLVVADADAAIGDMIRELDDEAMLIVRSLPVVLALDDERLRRVKTLDPDAWWVFAVGGADHALRPERRLS